MKVLTDSDIIEMLKKGFECLGNVSPMAEPEEVIYNSRQSIDNASTIWRFYLLGNNEEFITSKGIAYTINKGAKSFTSVHCSKDFIHIDVGDLLFNHYAAIKCITDNS